MTPGALGRYHLGERGPWLSELYSWCKQWQILQSSCILHSFYWLVSFLFNLWVSWDICRRIIDTRIRNLSKLWCLYMNFIMEIIGSYMCFLRLLYNKVPQTWWLKTKEMHSLTVLGTGSPKSLTWANIKVRAGPPSFQKPQGRMRSLPFPALDGDQSSLACGCIFKLPSPLLSHCLLLCLCEIIRCLLLWGYTWLHSGPTKIIQDNLPVSNSQFNVSRLPSLFWLYKVVFTGSGK